MHVIHLTLCFCYYILQGTKSMLYTHCLIFEQLCLYNNVMLLETSSNKYPLQDILIIFIVIYIISYMCYTYAMHCVIKGYLL